MLRLGSDDGTKQVGAEAHLLSVRSTDPYPHAYCGSYYPPGGQCDDVSRPTQRAPAARRPRERARQMLTGCVLSPPNG